MFYTRAVTTALPKISPLVIKRRAAAFDNHDLLFELKYDGFRALTGQRRDLMAAVEEHDLGSIVLREPQPPCP
jgi:hypothetical protein